jgi:hypothetical protein
MTALVTKTDLDGYKYIADSVKNSTSWPQHVSEAQLFDVKSWLGDALLNELVTQASTSPTTLTPENELLLEGGTYVYGTKTYLFQGLKACIMYFAFARFTNRNSINYTAAGVVIKDSDFSTPATDKIIQRLETEARMNAEAIKCEIITFLNRNYSDYPLWRHSTGACAGGCSHSRPFKIIGD